VAGAGRRGDGSGADVPAGARAPVGDAVPVAHPADPPRARVPLPRRRRRALLPARRYAHQLRAAGEPPPRSPRNRSGWPAKPFLLLLPAASAAASVMDWGRGLRVSGGKFVLASVKF